MAKPKWSPRNFADHLVARKRGELTPAAEADAELKTRSVPWSDVPQCQCPSCGAWTWPFALVDVRALPIPETWACDGCWTHWIRTGRIVDGAALDKVKWLELHGAPAAAINHIRERARNDANYHPKVP